MTPCHQIDILRENNVRTCDLDLEPDNVRVCELFFGIKAKLEYFIIMHHNFMYARSIGVASNDALTHVRPKYFSSHTYDSQIRPN